MNIYEYEITPVWKDENGNVFEGEKEIYQARKKEEAINTAVFAHDDPYVPYELIKLIVTDIESGTTEVIEEQE